MSTRCFKKHIPTCCHYFHYQIKLSKPQDDDDVPIFNLSHHRTLEGLIHITISGLTQYSF